MRAQILQDYSLLVQNDLCTIIVGYGTATLADNVKLFHFDNQSDLLEYIQINQLIINNPDWRTT